MAVVLRAGFNRPNLRYEVAQKSKEGKEDLGRDVVEMVKVELLEMLLDWLQRDEKES